MELAGTLDEKDLSQNVILKGIDNVVFPRKWH
jgi:hypothetical protein